jgi:3D (Asp-Asp-Asp) domain-containing protein
MYSPSRKMLGRVSPGLAMAVVLVSGCFSDAVARPAAQDDGTAAVGAKASEENVVEIPGSFKNFAAAPASRTSKSAQRRSVLQRKDSPISKANVDLEKGLAARRDVTEASKARRIKIPVSLIDAGRVHDFNATAYSLKGRTASGHKVRQGVIAADPRVLPIGTIVHLQAGEYSGVYTVLDTGGRIKGRIIDVYLPTRKEAMRFGRRQVKLKVIGRSSLTASRSTAAHETGNF